jgi:hypothetical protein
MRVFCLWQTQIFLTFLLTLVVRFTGKLEIRGELINTKGYEEALVGTFVVLIPGALIVCTCVTIFEVGTRKTRYTLTAALCLRSLTVFCVVFAGASGQGNQPRDAAPRPGRALHNIRLVVFGRRAVPRGECRDILCL